MPTITLLNVPAKVVRALKALAKRQAGPWSRKCCDLLGGCVAERRAVLDQLEAGWTRQARRPTAAEVDGWPLAGDEGQRCRVPAGNFRSSRAPRLPDMPGDLANSDMSYGTAVLR